MADRILIVDDEPDVGKVLKEALEDDGFQTDAVLSGEEALEALKTTRYQAILVDVRLGGAVSGIDVIRRAGGLTERPALVVISATPENLLAPIFEKEGIGGLVDRSLEKPGDLNPDVVPRLVKAVLEKHRRGKPRE